MRVRFKKDSSKNHTMYAGTQYEFTYVSMGYGFRTNIKTCINWDETPEGELVEAVKPSSILVIHLVYSIGNTPASLKR